ncbi:MAG: polymer-forming cytoskeletal protein [Hellea sp.]|nr:polymer-forming cytoskeletal protein [Hellea sp.]
MFSKTNSAKPAQPAMSEPSKKSTPRPVSAAPSILGRDITILGEIRTDGDIQIDGRHEGNITASTITIGESGAISGEIKAKAVYVRGKVNGKINASLVELAETANVKADITQDKLTIANGAFFDGKCSRRKQAAAPVAKVSAVPTPAKKQA